MSQICHVIIKIITMKSYLKIPTLIIVICITAIALKPIKREYINVIEFVNSHTINSSNPLGF